MLAPMLLPEPRIRALRVIFAYWFGLVWLVVGGGLV